ncbi:MAG: hypothetical protein ABW097_08780 [Candidatus Thiodiazotropha lotti]
MTNEECIVEGEFGGTSFPSIPIFFNEYGVFEPASEYLVHQRIFCRSAISSLKTYADHLQMFFRELEKHDIAWSKVNDAVLIKYRNKLMEEGKEPAYLVSVFNTLWGFYYWAEEHGRLKQHVAIHSEKGRKYPVSAKKNVKANGVHDWVWPYMPKSKTSMKNTPNNEDMEKIHQYAAESHAATNRRDYLILALYERTARRMEAMQTTVSVIPEWDEITDASYEDKIFTIPIIGKRGISRSLNVTPEYMEEARNYIENERAKAVSDAHARDPNYVEPEELFLSQTTGKPLALGSVSNLIRSFIKGAGIKDMAPHRIRAKAATDICEAHDGFDSKGNPLSADDVLLRVIEELGQSCKESARPYLALARTKKGDGRVASIEKLRALQFKLQEKNAL